MQTVFETRRARLKELISRFGTIAALNAAMGWETTNPRLSQIQNRSIRSDRGTAYEMGDATAREIEERLGLDCGWMDTPPGYELLENDKLRELNRVALELAPYQIDQLIMIGTTLAHVPPESPQRPSQPVQQTVVSPSAGSTQLTAVQGVVAKKIGKGYFGPPADGSEEDKRGSNKDGKVSRRGHAGRSR